MADDRFAQRLARRFAPAATALALLLGVAPAVAEDWRISAGVDYSSGDYGLSSDTEILYLPLTLRYQDAAWTAKASLSYLSVTGPGGVLVGGTVIGSADSGQRETETGMGDVWLSLSYAVDTPLAARTYYDLTAKVKLPTADEDRGLGTGATDVAVQVDVYYAGEQTSPFAALGYKFMGDPDGIDYNDVLYFSIGSGRPLGDDQSIGLIYDFRQSATDSGDDASELTAYHFKRWNARWSNSVYGVLGFSDNSPDYALGVQFNHDF